MNVLIVAEFLDNIKNPNTYNSRFFTVADMLVEKGHQVRIVTTNFIHSLKQHVSDVSNYKECELIALSEPGYSNNISIRRFWSHRMLSKNLRQWLKKNDKPDVIYCAIPSLDFAYEAARYAKKNGIKLVIDVQDLWPEAFEMVIDIPFVKRILFLPFRIRADYIYRVADRVVAVSETYANRVLRVNKKAKCAEVVFLGTDLVKFDNYKSEEITIKKDTGELWLGYIGTLGRSYDLKTVMNGLELLKEKLYYPKIKLIVMGDGLLRQDFEEYALKKQLNVCFTGMLPYSKMVAILCKCDIAINPIRKKSAGSIINKHGDYAAAGIPVINTQESVEYHRLIDSYNMGLNCMCEDAVDMSAKLDELIRSEVKRKSMGVHARMCAEELFDRTHTYKKIINSIEC